jgi:tetratricopeptide (TPR) repeat protein
MKSGPAARAKREAAPPPARDRAAAMYALLVCATLAAYLPALRGGLVWDDMMHVTRADLRSLHGLWRIWFELGATQQYYPLLHSAFWLEHRLWGDAVLGYHLLNVLLHATSACLLVAILRRLAVPGAALAGLLFAVHPVAVEAVAWISEQKSALSGAFYLAAALTYLSFDRSRRRSQYFAALALFLLALMTKSVTATLPAALLVVFWWQRGRLDLRRDVLPLAPWLAAGAAAGLFTAWVEAAPRLIGAQGSMYALSLGQRLLLAGRVPWFYAWKALVPVDLMFVYPRWTLDPGDWRQWLFPAATLASAAVLVWLARRRRGPLAAFLFFAGTLFPVLGFLNVYPFRYSFVADHFQYLALLGILVPAAALLSRWKASAALAAVRAVAALAQCSIYRDYETLFRSTLARNPGSAFAHNNLGVLLMSSGREREALPEFEQAVRLAPESADYRVNLGLALAQAPGRLGDAVAEYRTALQFDPKLPAAHLNLGLAYTAMPGRLDDAIAEYRQAIAQYEGAARTEPELWQAHFNLGLAYGQMPGREADAISEYRAALRLKPDSALTHFHLGNTLHKSRRLPEAIEEYRASIALDPAVPEVHYELAYALAQIPGRVPEAVEECRRMLVLKPDDPAGRQLLASLLSFQQAQR